ncbi:MFS transporter [Spongiactinospora sp. 9N601]|uniref:MFS transporter n=1 Tax=Spongiactinospora sp. 9N601 TaxID=3375149 RepID=UPI0037988293
MDIEPRPAVTLAAVLLGFLALPMLMSGTTVALPQIGADLHASGPALQWVLVGYFLAASSLMLVAGSLGDLFGRRRIFAIGAVIYTTGAGISALAHDIVLLNAARTLSGMGAAGVLAGGGAILGATFTGTARTRAFAATGTTAGIGLAAGPALSGALVDSLGWRTTFAAFAAVGLVLGAATWFMPESRAADRHRIDLPGTLTLIGALALVMFGINQAAAAGWGEAQVFGPIGAGLLLLVAFTRIEHRSPHPVLDLSMLRDRRFMAWSLAGLFVVAGPAGVEVYLPVYLQGAGTSSARSAGLSMLMLTAPVLLLPQVAARLINRGIPPRRLITLSLLLIAAGNAWLTVLHPAITTLELLGPLATIGIGLGLGAGLADAQALNQVGADRIGMATGLLNTIRAGGSTLTMTAFGTGLITLLQSRVGAAQPAARIAAGDLTGPDQARHAALFTDAWQFALWSVAALCTVIALAVWAFLAPSRRRAAADHPSGSGSEATLTPATVEPISQPSDNRTSNFPLEK